jgi:7,8-dihydroneopterin aldolase/epimerase/oxygenase
VSDRVLIRDLRVMCHVGVPSEERAQEQEIVIDADLSLDLRPAGRADDLNLTVNYSVVREIFRAAVQRKPYALIEAIAETLAAEALREFPVERARVRVTKPAALRRFGTALAAVEIERGREG